MGFSCYQYLNLNNSLKRRDDEEYIEFIKEKRDDAMIITLRDNREFCVLFESIACVEDIE